MGKKCNCCCRGPRGPRGPTGPSGSPVPGPTGPEGLEGPTGFTGSTGPTGLGPELINISTTVQFICEAWLNPVITSLRSSRLEGLEIASLSLGSALDSGVGLGLNSKIVGEVPDTTIPQPSAGPHQYAIRVLNGTQGTNDTLGLLTLEAVGSNTRITVERVPASSADFEGASTTVGFYPTTVTYPL